MTTSKTTKTNDLISSIIWVAVICMGVSVMLPDIFDFYFVRSKFLAALPEKPLFWQPWHISHITLAIQMLSVAFAVGTVLVRRFLNGYISDLLQKLIAASALCLLVASFVVLIYCDTIGGYAIYNNRFVSRVPFIDKQAISYRLQDIDHVEVGCHRQYLSLGRGGVSVRPVYNLHMRDHRVYSLISMAPDAENVSLSKLSWAVVTLDENIRAQSISRRHVSGNASDPAQVNRCLAQYADRITRPESGMKIIKAFSVE